MIPSGTYESCDIIMPTVIGVARGRVSGTEEWISYDSLSNTKDHVYLFS